LETAVNVSDMLDDGGASEIGAERCVRQNKLELEDTISLHEQESFKDYKGN
jgi:hypothetical protein